MFEMIRSQSRSAFGAIMYVTIGTLLVIWAGLAYYYFVMPDPEAPMWQRFLCVGTILSGIAVASIGLLFGLIGRAAKPADTNTGVAATAPVAVAPTAVGAPGVAVAGSGPDVRRAEPSSH
jgi:uncharacterized BrkB/YihY/UPF0761 family membrane protein